MGKSNLEQALLSQIRLVGIPDPEQEYRFHPERRWRFDFCWPDKMLAVEVEGGVYSRGRHVRGSGFEKDCEKYNQAAIMGWSVLRFTAGMIENGEAVSKIEEALNE